MDFKKDILNKDKWIAFKNKVENAYQVDSKLLKSIDKILADDLYLQYYDDVINHKFFIDKARKIEIPKLGSDAKRVVYSFNLYQTVFLKFVNFLLRDYDYLFVDNLFSYRSNITPIHISYKIHSIVKKQNMFAYKCDIHDYFRSIDVSNLLNILRNNIKDVALLKFLNELLSQNEFLYQNEIIKDSAGAIPGMPISGFFADIYLNDVDHYFLNQGIQYFRYADDIIIFCNSYEELITQTNVLKDKLREHGLVLNPKKECIFKPEDSIEFLGIKYNKDIRDVSNVSFQKIKGKIRRSARSFRRWMLKNNVSYGQTLYAFNKKFNNRFYAQQDGEICWALWYFPIINTDETISLIDKYYQQEARYIKTGKHNKMNYKNVDYQLLKTYGYKPLKTSYYKFKNHKN